MTDPNVLRRLERLEKEIERLTTLERPEYVSGAAATWTPSFVGTTTAGTFTYSVRLGYYTRIGNVVNVWGNLAVATIPVAPTGNVVITGLPYTAQNTANLFGVITVAYAHNFNYTAAAIALHGRVNPNLTYIYLSESFDSGGAVDIPPGSILTTTQLVFGGSYLI